jgi:hypothetical protein
VPAIFSRSRRESRVTARSYARIGSIERPPPEVKLRGCYDERVRSATAFAITKGYVSR